MAKHGESEGEVLSRDEMKSTKGGAGIPAPDPATASSQGLSAAEMKKLERSLADTSLAEEALNISPVAPPAVGAGAPPRPKV